MHLFQINNNKDFTVEKLANISLILILAIIFTSCSTDPNCIEGNCQDGKGTYLSPDGDKYVGEFKNGKRNGQGTRIYPGGYTYVGEFKDGNFSGQGTYTYANGAKYTGEFKYGFPHGKGVEISADGNRQEGYWVMGEYAGQKKPSLSKQ